jgi:CspA family cold shock protein
MVKYFDENKGYGYIRDERDGQSVYVHYADIEGEGFRTLSEGELVEYDLAGDPRHRQAVNVRVIPRSV